jgi:hypothetical protein
MAYLSRPFLRKLKCFINLISLGSHSMKVKDALPFAGRRVKYSGDKVLSLGLSMVGRSRGLTPQVFLPCRWFRAATILRLGETVNYMAPTC